PRLHLGEPGALAEQLRLDRAHLGGARGVGQPRQAGRHQGPGLLRQFCTAHRDRSSIPSLPPPPSPTGELTSWPSATALPRTGSRSVGPGPVPRPTRRCRAASKATNAPATAALSDSTAPSIGMLSRPV